MKKTIIAAFLGVLAAGPAAAHPGFVQEAKTAPELKVELTQQMLQGILTAEIASELGNSSRAFNEFMDAAKLTGDARLARKAYDEARRMGNHRHESQALNLWLVLDPNDTRARFHSAFEDLRSGNYVQAEQEFLAVMKEDANPTELLAKFVEMRTGLGNKEDFYDIFRKMAKGQKEDAMLLMLSAKAASFAGYKRDAAAFAARASDANPDNPHMLVECAEYEYELDPEKTIARLKDFLKKKPGNMNVFSALAKILVMQGNSNALENLLKSNDKIARDNPETMYWFGMVAQQGNLPQYAELCFTRYLVAASKPDGAELDKNKCYIALGNLAADKGQTERAVEWYHKVDGGRHYIMARVREAELLAGLSRIDESCAVLRSVRTENSEQRIELCKSCAELYARSDEIAKAYEVLKELSAEFPENAEITYLAAGTAEKAGMKAESVELYGRYIEQRPQDPFGHIAYGMALIAEGRIAAAALHIEEGYNLSSGRDPRILNAMGMLRKHQGDYGEAEQFLRRAYANSVTFESDIILNLAEVLALNGKKSEAIAIVMSVLNSEPENEDALKLLRKIDPR